MSTVTKPILLDETGQAIKTAIDNLYLGKKVVVNVNNLSWGTVSGGGGYPSGTTVTLTATPNTGCAFAAWKDANGNILGTESTLTLTVLSDYIIQAIFIDDDDFEIVAWSTGNIEKIAKMIGAAYSGLIVLADYWSAGDSFSTNIDSILPTGGEGETAWSVNETQPSQSITLTIMDTVCDGFFLANDNTKRVKLIVGVKDCLANQGYMNPSTGTTWVNCARKNWCNYGFREALPDSIKALFKKFSWTVSGSNNSEDWFAIASLNFVRNPDSTQGVWEWYQSSEHLIKTKNATPVAWFTSTPNGANREYVAITSTGGLTYPDQNQWSYFSPFGCI